MRPYLKASDFSALCLEQGLQIAILSHRVRSDDVPSSVPFPQLRAFINIAMDLGVSFDSEALHKTLIVALSCGDVEDPYALSGIVMPVLRRIVADRPFALDAISCNLLTHDYLGDGVFGNETFALQALISLLTIESVNPARHNSSAIGQWIDDVQPVFFAASTLVEHLEGAQRTYADSLMCTSENEDEDPWEREARYGEFVATYQPLVICMQANARWCRIVVSQGGMVDKDHTEPLSDKEMQKVVVALQHLQYNPSRSKLVELAGVVLPRLQALNQAVATASAGAPQVSTPFAAAAQATATSAEAGRGVGCVIA